MKPRSMLRRLLDVSVAGAALLLTTPILAVAALLIRLEDPGPALFRQVRVGRDGKPFQLLKLRSMRIHNLAPTEIGQVTDGHPMVTRVGAVLRRSKIDELPQLLNVLRGDMSLVGPRPTLPEQVSEYSDFQRRRLSVRPGLTGWAQVNGNVSLSWSDRIALDVWYVDHRTCKLDIEILTRTLKVVLTGERPQLRAVTEARRYADGAGRSGGGNGGSPADNGGSGQSAKAGGDPAPGA